MKEIKGKRDEIYSEVVFTLVWSIPESFMKRNFERWLIFEMRNTFHVEQSG